MVKTTLHTPSTTEKCQIEIQSTVAMLEESMFIRPSDLLARVMVAAKDTNSRISWVTFDPAYHSVLVRMAIATTKANGLKHSTASIKEALFNFLLDILNGKPQKAFFTKLEPGRMTRMVSTRDHKHTRPHQKGNQANNNKDNSNNSPLPPSPPPPPPPPTCTTGSEPPDRPQPTTAGDNTRAPSPSAPLQAHPRLPVSTTHDTFSEDAEEFCAQLERSMQEKSECEALLMEALVEANMKLNVETTNTSKPNPRVTRSTTRKKVMTPIPSHPTHPTTRQDMKGERTVKGRRE